MFGAVFFCLLIIFQDDPPFKPKGEFEIKFDLSFRHRTSQEHTPVRIEETMEERQRRLSANPLPYLNLAVKILHTQPEEVRLKVIKDDLYSIMNKKKIKKGVEFTIEVGFTDDVKDKLSGYKHVIQFLSEEKRVISIILIEFDEEGNYSVNGEKRGKV
jgi:hypothetical protein